MNFAYMYFLVEKSEIEDGEIKDSDVDMEAVRSMRVFIFHD